MNVAMHSKEVIYFSGENVYLPHYKTAASAGNGIAAEAPEINQLLAFKSGWIKTELFAKRIERQLDGRNRVVSDNKMYDPYYLAGEGNVKLIGEVVWVSKRM